MVIYDSKGEKKEYMSVSEYFDRKNDFMEVDNVKFPFD